MMKTLKKLFFSTALITVVFTAFTKVVQAQRTNAPAIIFQAEDMDAYFVSKIPTQLRDGELLVATFKTDRTQIIAKIRAGKIVEIGIKSVGKNYTELRQRKTDNCGLIHYCIPWQLQRCFHTPWGQCICICGAWFSAGN